MPARKVFLYLMCIYLDLILCKDSDSLNYKTNSGARVRDKDVFQGRQSSQMLTEIFFGKMMTNDKEAVSSRASWMSVNSRQRSFASLTSTNVGTKLQAKMHDRDALTLFGSPIHGDIQNSRHGDKRSKMRQNVKSRHGYLGNKNRYSYMASTDGSKGLNSMSLRGTHDARRNEQETFQTLCARTGWQKQSFDLTLIKTRVGKLRRLDSTRRHSVLSKVLCGTRDSDGRGKVKSTMNASAGTFVGPTRNATSTRIHQRRLKTLRRAFVSSNQAGPSNTATKAHRYFLTGYRRQDRQNAYALTKKSSVNDLPQIAPILRRKIKPNSTRKTRSSLASNDKESRVVFKNPVKDLILFLSGGHYFYGNKERTDGLKLKQNAEKMSASITSPNEGEKQKLSLLLGRLEILRHLQSPSLHKPSRIGHILRGLAQRTPMTRQGIEPPNRLIRGQRLTEVHNILFPAFREIQERYFQRFVFHRHSFVSIVKIQDLHFRLVKDDAIKVGAQNSKKIMRAFESAKRRTRAFESVEVVVLIPETRHRISKFHRKPKTFLDRLREFLKTIGRYIRSVIRSLYRKLKQRLVANKAREASSSFANGEGSRQAKGRSGTTQASLMFKPEVRGSQNHRGTQQPPVKQARHSSFKPKVLRRLDLKLIANTKCSGHEVLILLIDRRHVLRLACIKRTSAASRALSWRNKFRTVDALNVRSVHRLYGYPLGSQATSSFKSIVEAAKERFLTIGHVGKKRKGDKRQQNFTSGMHTKNGTVGIRKPRSQVSTSLEGNATSKFNSKVRKSDSRPGNRLKRLGQWVLKLLLKTLTQIQGSSAGPHGIAENRMGIGRSIKHRVGTRERAKTKVTDDDVSGARSRHRRAAINMPKRLNSKQIPQERIAEGVFREEAKNVRMSARSRNTNVHDDLQEGRVAVGTTSKGQSRNSLGGMDGLPDGDADALRSKLFRLMQMVRQSHLEEEQSSSQKRKSVRPNRLDAETTETPVLSPFKYDRRKGRVGYRERHSRKHPTQADRELLHNIEMLTFSVLGKGGIDEEEKQTFGSHRSHKTRHQHSKGEGGRKKSKKKTHLIRRRSTTDLEKRTEDDLAVGENDDLDDYIRTEGDHNTFPQRWRVLKDTLNMLKVQLLRAQSKYSVMEKEIRHLLKEGNNLAKTINRKLDHSKSNENKQKGRLKNIGVESKKLEKKIKLEEEKQDKLESDFLQSGLMKKVNKIKGQLTKEEDVLEGKESFETGMTSSNDNDIGDQAVRKGKELESMISEERPTAIEKEPARRPYDEDLQHVDHMLDKLLRDRVRRGVIDPLDLPAEGVLENPKIGGGVNTAVRWKRAAQSEPDGEGDNKEEEKSSEEPDGDKDKKEQNSEEPDKDEKKDDSSEKSEGEKEEKKEQSSEESDGVEDGKNDDSSDKTEVDKDEKKDDSSDKSEGEKDEKKDDSSDKVEGEKDEKKDDSSNTEGEKDEKKDDSSDKPEGEKDEKKDDSSNTEGEKDEKKDDSSDKPEGEKDKKKDDSSDMSKGEKDKKKDDSSDMSEGGKDEKKEKTSEGTDGKKDGKKEKSTKGSANKKDDGKKKSPQAGQGKNSTQAKTDQKSKKEGAGDTKKASKGKTNTTDGAESKKKGGEDGKSSPEKPDSKSKNTTESNTSNKYNFDLRNAFKQATRDLHIVFMARQKERKKQRKMEVEMDRKITEVENKYLGDSIKDIDEQVKWFNDARAEEINSEDQLLYEAEEDLKQREKIEKIWDKGAFD